MDIVSIRLRQVAVDIRVAGRDEDENVSHKRAPTTCIRKDLIRSKFNGLCYVDT